MNEGYQLALRRYADIGIDTEKALQTLASIPVSIHCWQGDDVVGFDQGDDNAASGGILNRVDLPTPLGPITPTMPLRGKLNERSSIRARSPNCLCKCSTSRTLEPKRGPTGMVMSVKSTLLALRASASICS